VGTIVALIWATWIWSNWVGIVLAGVFELSQKQVPFSTDGTGTTTAVCALSINDGFNFVDDWFVLVVAEVHQVTCDCSWSIALALVTVSVPVAVELVHRLSQLAEDGIGVIIVGILSVESSIRTFNALE